MVWAKPLRRERVVGRVAVMWWCWMESAYHGSELVDEWLCRLGQGNVDRSRCQISVAQGFLHCFQVGASGHVVRGHRVSECMY